MLITVARSSSLNELVILRREEEKKREGEGHGGKEKKREESKWPIINESIAERTGTPVIENL